MKLAVTSRTLCDVSGKHIADIPDGVGEIQTLKMVRASGNLSALLDLVAQESPALQHVNVSSCSLADLNRDSLCRVIAKSTVRQVDAAHLRRVSVPDMSEILQALNPDCRVLNLGDMVVLDLEPSVFAHFSRFNGLENLSLAGWSVKDADLMQLPVSLSELSLARASSLTSFAFLERLSALRALDLDGVRLTESAQDALVEALSEKKNLCVRVNMTRLPQERVLSASRMALLPNISFY